MVDYTVVLGIDSHTIKGLRQVVPTWRQNKPSLMKQRFLVFYDGVAFGEIRQILHDVDLNSYQWPFSSMIEYQRENKDKWTNSQRAKMLAGFCYIPNQVTTKYWLKLDLDVIATGQDDWVDPHWFDSSPAIVAPSWSYTKPADSMMKMDVWAHKHQYDVWMKKVLGNSQPLNLVPELGSTMVCHSRICSWCAFFRTEFTKECSLVAHNTLGIGQIPIDSQDGFHWYMAKRSGQLIVTVPMKRHGWKLCKNVDSVEKELQKA